jgi:hypothetical protein
MNANASSPVAVGAALPWAVTLFLVASAASAQSEYRSIDISVASDPRPVAKAIDTLVREFPFVVTYEDPTLEFGGDIRDYTSERRNPLNVFLFPHLRAPPPETRVRCWRADRSRCSGATPCNHSRPAGR